MKQSCLTVEREPKKFNFIDVQPTTEAILDMPGMLFQRKFDGVSSEVIIEEGIRIVGKGITKGRISDYTSKFPELIEALNLLHLPEGTDFLPEIIVMNRGTGREDLSLAQMRAGRESNANLYSKLYPAMMVIHDVVSVGGVDVSHLDYHERKNALKPLIYGAQNLIYFIGGSADGKGEWQHVLAQKNEGLVIRNPKEPLGRNVRKLKRVLSEDVFCTGEFTPSISDAFSTFEYSVGSEKRKGLFANLICYQISPEGRIFHVCDVGGGFSIVQRVQIQQMLDLGLISKERPLVMEIKANARFEDGKLRHNTFLRMRSDKPWDSCIVKEVI